MQFRLMTLLLVLGLFFAGPWSGGDLAAQSTPVARNAEEICQSYVGTPAPETDPATSNMVVDLAALDFDVIYLEAMIPHHQIALEMATILLERTNRPEMKEFASSIIESRQVEIAMMTGWRADWYPDIPTLTQMQLVDAMNMALSANPGVGGLAGLEEMGSDHLIDDLLAVCGSDDDLDITFIDTLLAQNSSALILSREAVNRTVHREAKQLADSVISEQQFEIDQVLAWREIWFPGTPIPDHHD